MPFAHKSWLFRTVSQKCWDLVGRRLCTLSVFGTRLLWVWVILPGPCLLLLCYVSLHWLSYTGSLPLTGKCAVLLLPSFKSTFFTQTSASVSLSSLLFKSAELTERVWSLLTPFEESGSTSFVHPLILIFSTPPQLLPVVISPWNPFSTCRPGLTGLSIPL